MCLTQVSNKPNNLPYVQIFHIATISNSKQTVCSNVIQILIQSYGDTMVIIFILV